MNGRGKFIFILFLVFTSSTIVSSTSEKEEDNIFFTINFLSPVSHHPSYSIPFYLAEQLPKIGIGIQTHEATGWGNIVSRTWEYPVGEDYDFIPPYSKGGYDILFLGWNKYLDWDPTNKYGSTSIVPNGDNFYQFNNTTFDSLLSIYNSTNNLEEMFAKGMKLQEILFEQLPSIPIYYSLDLFAFDINILGINTRLLGEAIHRPEYWRNLKNDSIIYALPGPIREINLFIQNLPHEAIWQQCIYYGLFERDPLTLFMEPLIAKNYTISTDGLTYTININPNAFFSNGDPVTAYDVAYTYHLLVNDSVSPFSTYKSLMKHFSSTDSIVPLNQSTIQFTIKNKYSFALSNLFSYGILNKKLISTYIADNGLDFKQLNQSLVTGCGPYSLNLSSDFIDEYPETEINKVILRPNPYWALSDNSSLLNEIIFEYYADYDEVPSLLEEGAIDVIDCDFFNLNDFKGIENIKLVLEKAPELYEMAINMRHPRLGTGELTPVGTAEAAKNIRKAISYAFNRSYIVEEFMEKLAEPASTTCPSASVQYNKDLDPYPCDLGKAKELIEQAGYEYPEETKTSFSFIIPLICFIGLLVIVVRKNRS